VGREFADTVCIELSNCVDDFKFFLVYQQEGIREPVDGILGLARNQTMYLNSNYTNDGSSLYLLALREQNRISELTVSFYFSPPGYESSVDFGAP
jgi:hypothetical protein